MQVMLINKSTNVPVFIDNAISVRIRCNFYGTDCWEVETADDEILRSPCMEWHIYLHYEQK